MRMIMILLGTALVTFSLALRAEWQWNGASGEDYQEEDKSSEATWSDEDCEAISEAAGVYLWQEVTLALSAGYSGEWPQGTKPSQRIV